ncbi:MAG: hypothetical protein ABSE66_09385 [Thermoplasmata archaeon]|jgi:hypothetical protein
MRKADEVCTKYALWATSSPLNYVLGFVVPLAALVIGLVFLAMQA